VPGLEKERQNRRRGAAGGRLRSVGTGIGVVAGTGNRGFGRGGLRGRWAAEKRPQPGNELTHLSCEPDEGPAF